VGALAALPLNGVPAGPHAVAWLAVIARPVVRDASSALVVALVVAALVVMPAAAVAAGRLPRRAILLRAGPASASRMPNGPVAAVALAPVASAAAVPARAARMACEVFRIFRSHVSGGQNDSNKDNHDNCRQADHKLSHRTIQNDMAPQCGASETRAAIDAGLTQ
jgi:hypothetical protein